MDASDERKFLHDLATPLGTATLLLDAALDDARGRSSESSDDVVLLEKLHKALDRMKTLLQDRRAALVVQGNTGAKS